jgi:prepilin-type N-terminal cleavage/methylation domain-containing protein
MTGCSNKKGFTIIEMLIASVVFSIIFGAAVGMLVTSMKLQKYNLLHNELLNQTSYASEYIARFLRMAVKSPAAGTCIPAGSNYQILNGGSKIKFLNYKGGCQEFFLNASNKIEVKITDISSGNIILSAPLTSADFQIVNLLFSVAGDSGGDSQQPRATFYMELRGTKLPTNPSVKIETTVSQRNLDK